MNYLKSFVHNVIIHPLMMFLLLETACRMHNKTMTGVWGKNRYDELKLEGMKKGK